MRALLRNRNFRLLLAGQTLTMFGDVAMFLVLGIWVKSLTESSGAAGAVFLVIALPSLVAPLGGVVVDRFPRRLVMIWTDLSTALVVLMLLFVRSRDDIWLIYAVAGVYGLSQQVFFAARSGLLVSMLTDERLGEANSALESVRQGLRLVAPLAGAVLFAAAGGGAVAILDAGTFLASAAFLATLRFEDVPRHEEREPFLREVAAGLRHVRRTPVISRAVWIFVLCLTVVGFLEPALFALTDDGLRRPPSFIGVIAAVQGIGSIAGGLTAPSVLRRVGESTAIGAGLVLLGLSLVGLVFPTVPVVMICVVAFGAALTVLLVAYTTLLQRNTPMTLQGRVFSAGEALYSAPYALSIGAGAALVSVVGFRVLYAANAVVLTALGALMVWLAARDRPRRAVTGGSAPPPEPARDRDPLRP